MAKHRNIANKELHQAMIGFRRSSAAQPHEDRRLRRSRTKKDVIRISLKDYS
jgi:hypothetical protein